MAYLNQAIARSKQSRTARNLIYRSKTLFLRQIDPIRTTRKPIYDLGSPKPVPLEQQGAR